MLEKNCNHIDKNAHYFCLMNPINTFMGLISFTCSTDPQMWFECYVDEERYKVDDNYKITLRAINGCAYEHYYQTDFLSLMHDGCIIKKTSDDMHIESVSFDEYIPNTIAYIHHEGQCVVGTFEGIKVGDKVRVRYFSFLAEVTDIADNSVVITWEYDGETHFDTVLMKDILKE